MHFTTERSIELALMRYDALRAEFGADMKHNGYRAEAYRDALTRRQTVGIPSMTFPNGGTTLNVSTLYAVFSGSGWCEVSRKVIVILKATQTTLWERIQGTMPKPVSEPRKGQIPAGILQLAQSASAIAAIRQDLIRCGFELEFQALNGSKDCGEVNEEALSDASYDAWNELSYDATFLLVGYNSYAVKKLLELARELYPQKDMGELIDLFDGVLHTKIESTVEDTEREFRDNWEYDNRSEYMSEVSPYDDLEVSHTTKALIDCGSDQSVDGGEIRTLGALTPMQFLSASADLLDNNTFEVDTGCSFHIHLSVPGVNHTYGTQLQSEMIAYILDNKARLPESVRDRLVSEKLDHFAKLRVSTDKFTAIHFHSAQRTWEFRLFGNVSDSADARRCLILAIEALRWAYRVKLGMETSLVTQAVMQNFSNVALQAREDGSSFKKERRNQAIAAQNAA